MSDLTGRSAVNLTSGVTRGVALGDECGLYCPACDADITHLAREALEHFATGDLTNDCPGCGRALVVAVDPQLVTARLRPSALEARR